MAPRSDTLAPSARPAPPRRARATVPALALALALAVGCVGCSKAAPRPAAPTQAPTSVATSADDGVLRIGVLRPTGADAVDLNASLLGGVDLAVGELRAAGQRVEIVQRDEGDPQLTNASITEMIDTGVDAIVGPMSSTVALATLATPVAAGIPSCSPTATALALDEFPDRGLFFRTVPSDALEARALAELVDRTGASTASIAFIDDDYGRPFADAVEVALRERPISVRRVAFRSDDASITSAAQTIAAAHDQAIVVLGDAAAVPAMVGAIGAAGAGQVPIIVNDAARNTVGAATDRLARRELVSGAAPQAVNPDDDFAANFAERHPGLGGAFAENAYQCINLIALAAVAGKSTAPAVIAANIPEVSVGGSLCDTFAQCKELLDEQRNIDYSPTTLTTSGELAVAAYDIFTVGQAGLAEDSGVLRVSR